MNVYLKKQLQFSTGLVYRDQFQINSYDVILKILTVSTDHDEQNIAYERMKYWIDYILQDSVLIDEHSEKLPAYQETGQRLIVIPEEPVDQLIGIMLYLKINAIMEKRMVITEVELSSAVGEDISYTHIAGEELGPLGVDGWWSDSRPVWSWTKKKQTEDKVIEMDRMPEWGDLDLDWATEDKEKSTVVFADFSRNDDK